MKIVAEHHVAPLDLLRGSPSTPAELTLAWLGQAGFLMCGGGVRLAVDPYLSDSLAKKYAGTRFPHRRMMPPPAAPEALAPLDAVFCTHAHTDHMDPETLGPLAAANPQCRFVVPQSAADVALSRGVPPERMIAADAGQRGTLGPGLRWHAVASAHEDLAVDAVGRHLFLGYVLEIGGATVYHSGDCVPYPALAKSLTALGAHLALLPVNGRDAKRRAGGVPGNFTFDEAAALCREAGVPAMIACHFGMFDFNTVDPAWLDREIAKTASPRCVRPEIGVAYSLQEL